MSKADYERLGLKERVKKYEFELILLPFLLLRFVFKNILTYTKYFTQEPIFGLSETLNIVIGTSVMLLACLYLASIFGRIIRANGPDHEKPVIFFVALFLACPVTLPFLFDSNSLSGTQMLYPFALFVLSVFLLSKPFVKWLVPLICAVYFVPALYKSEVFFAVLRKEALLYVPLILLFLFLDMMKVHIEPSNKKKKQTANESNFSILFITSCVFSAGSYIYTLVRGKSYSEAFYGTEQKLNLYFLVCLLLAAPALFGAGVVLYKAVKSNYPANVYRIFLIAPFLLLLLSKNNYYGLWIPFLTISLFLLVFYSIWQKNPAILSAVRIAGDYLSENKFVFYIILIAMASFSNVSSTYLSDIFQKIFSTVPY
jgi:uncharacterized membrane protein (DUF485 family)